MRSFTPLIALLSAVALPDTVSAAVKYQCSNWKNVKTGASGGYTTGIIFNPNHKGLAYLRTDIGGTYRYNSWDDSWTPLTDGITSADWNIWGSDGIATDPTEVSRFYILAGMYTNNWDPYNATVLRSVDFGASFQRTPLPFKGGGNQDGRGLGERIAVDLNRGNVLYIGARAGQGLWKSTDYAASFSKVSSFKEVGDYPAQPPGGNDPWASPNGEIVGPTWITFDEKSGTKGSSTPRIFVGVAKIAGPTIFWTKDAGATWSAVPGQPEQGYIPHKGKLSPKENALYVSYANTAGPNGGNEGSVFRFDITNGTWTDITPEKDAFGFGGLAVDLQKPGTLIVAALNKWWPDTQIYRSLDSGKTWKKAYDWASTGYPNLDFNFEFDTSTAPWIKALSEGNDFGHFVGHWIDTLEINPFNSNHFLYGTGATVQGSKNLLQWDVPGGKFKLSSLSVGIEETAVLDLTSPPVGPPLVSAVGDIGGWVHEDLDTPPLKMHKWSTLQAVDYAGNVPTTLSRGRDVIDISTDSGKTWSTLAGSPTSGYHWKHVLSADGKVVVWSIVGGFLRSENGAAFVPLEGLPVDAHLASDKRNASLIYAAKDSNFYVSTDAGKTFSTASSVGGSVREINVNPYAPGDVWVAADNGLYNSKFPFTSWTKIADIASASYLGLGAAKSGTTYPSIYVAGYALPDWTQGLYRSDDQGKNWFKTNDNSKMGFAQFGPVAGDTRKWGRVYIGTNGRGTFYGEPACPAPVF